MDKQSKLHQDVRYTLHDTTAYGIYNGISEFEIADIVRDIRKTVDSEKKAFYDTFPEDIARVLNQDEELEIIALATYTPYPEDKNWNDEWKQIYRKAVEKKTATGYGTIPNAVIREKIENVIKEAVKKVEEEENKKTRLLDELKKKAQETGEKQLVKSWMESCNEPKEECNLDSVNQYILPDGTLKTIRTHTW